MAPTNIVSGDTFSTTERGGREEARKKGEEDIDMVTAY